MKHVFTLFALSVVSTVVGQTDCPLVHDSNNNGYVDLEDFLSILSLFGDADLDGDGLYDSQDDCIDMQSCNYLDHNAEFCTYPSANGDCSIDCPFDSDGDGICDVDCGFSMYYFGYEYQTVQIGGQCWFAGNLRTENYSNGEEIATGLNHFEWTTTNEGAFTSTTGSYGKLYNSYAILDPRGVCPSGWHIPSDSDWNILIELFGGADVAGEALKSVSGWNDGGNGTDSSGFSGLPGGYFLHDIDNWGQNWDAGYYGYWAGIHAGNGNVFSRILSSYSNQVGFGSGDYAVSIRCLRNRGCTDPGACNYDAGEDTESDETMCVFPEGCETCSGETDGSGTVVDNDADNDGVCNDDEILGCTNPEACNYVEEATDDDGSCDLSCAPPFAGCGAPVNYHGHTYSTIPIGEQCWFSENLRTVFYANGDSVHQGHSSAGPTLGATFVYSGGWDDYCGEGAVDPCNPDQTLEAYGRLYSWYTIDDARRICPKGWHVPTDAEWMQLESFLGMDEVELESTGGRGTDQGSKMKAIDGWNDDGNGTNESGFNGLPGGQLSAWGQEYEGTWQWYDIYQYGAGTSGHFWTSTLEEENAWQRSLSSSNDMVSRYTSTPHNGLSIRCVLGETGCTDPNACNYDATPTTETDNSMCIYPDGICESCSGETDGTGVIVDNDLDDDGVCNADEILGCVYDWGCNYAPDATEDDGSCDPSCAPEVVGCGAPFSYHGYHYQTVKIGNQCWFAENLKSETYSNGEAVDSSSTSMFSEEYGRLYSWYVVDDEQGVCPTGWHVPSSSDWGELSSFLGGFNVAGDKMKSTSGWNNDGNGTNESGFSALPGGQKSSSGTFSGQGNTARFWTTNSDDWGFGPIAYFRYLDSGPWLDGYESSVESQLSIRCMRASESSGCTDPGACNYDATPTLDINNDACIYPDGSCESCSGEMDGTGTVVFNDFNNDGVCEEGCIDSWACNYNASAEIDDESCEFDSCIPPDCGDPKGYQGYDYQTVQIGNQCWFAQNLRSERYTNGELMATSLTPYEWSNIQFGAMAIYDDPGWWCNSPTTDCSAFQTLEEYGRLYNWYAVTDDRGLCPVGWHLPTNTEWEELENHLGGHAAAGHQLKATSGWSDEGGYQVSPSGTNSSGFNGLPGGARVHTTCGSCGPNYNYAGTSGFWWTQTESSNGGSAIARSLSSFEYSLGESWRHKAEGCSIRCLKDSE